MKACRAKGVGGTRLDRRLLEKGRACVSGEPDTKKRATFSKAAIHVADRRAGGPKGWSQEISRISGSAVGLARSGANAAVRCAASGGR